MVWWCAGRPLSGARQCGSRGCVHFERDFVMTRLLAVALAGAALAPFHSLIGPVSGPTRADVKRNAWHRGCPVSLAQRRELTGSFVGVDRQMHIAQLAVTRE